MFAAWLIFTALRVLAKPMIFFNFVKSANVHRILALVNIALLIAFLLYLSQFLIPGFQSSRKAAI